MAEFDPYCQQCSRLDQFLKSVRTDYPGYHARPVAPFGVNNPRLLIVGLAPGLHGANATGRPFTGDYAGILLYDTLYKYGYANKPDSIHQNDGLRLKNCRITNAVKCVPPENKPTTGEINTCNSYLVTELQGLKSGVVILALGLIAHKAVLKALQLRPKNHPFAHGNTHALARDKWIIDSYHCSRYNTQTRRLTEKMFHEIFDKIHEILLINN